MSSCASCTATVPGCRRVRPRGDSSSTGPTSCAAEAGRRGRASSRPSSRTRSRCCCSPPPRSPPSPGIVDAGGRDPRGDRAQRRASRSLQERHAERAVEALRAYLPPHARVVRDGREQDVDARGARARRPAASSQRETGSARTPGCSRARSRSTCRRSPASRCPCSRAAELDDGRRRAAGGARPRLQRHDLHRRRGARRRLRDRHGHAARPHRRALAARRGRATARCRSRSAASPG